MASNRARRVGVVLFEGFELLDVYGPLQVWNPLAELFEVVVVAERCGPVSPSRGPHAEPAGPQTLASRSFAECEALDLLFVPGGFGTRREVSNPLLLEWLRERAGSAELVASVCTGSALLAAAGLLNGRRATSNKASFDWVCSQGEQVTWVRKARWVVDGKFWTSSGVAAGIDMALALLAHVSNEELARTVARRVEYAWHDDPAWDPFAELAR